MPKIGVFWIYRGTVIGRARSIEEGQENVPGLLDSPDSHIELWEQNPDFFIPFAALRGVEYQTIPRGRVLYSTKENKAIVYLDATLNTPQGRRAISEYFDLQDTPISWKTDTHYTTAPDQLDELF